MSSNVGLTTPRGSGTSGYVQRNSAFIKPRAAGYGAPYPPASSASFKQRMPDKQILEHDRMRAIEVQVMEERERLEEENERIEEEATAKKGKKEKEEGEEEEEKVLTEEEIDERCEALRQKLIEKSEGEKKMGPPKKGRNLKSYQVHELAEAKIEESERLRRALGIREDRDTGEISSGRSERNERKRD
jgi:hypothetical protein